MKIISKLIDFFKMDSTREMEAIQKLQGIIKAYKSNLTDIDEMADFFNVTPQYLSEAIECYHKKYGICTTVDNHIIYFEPCLAVMEII